MLDEILSLCDKIIDTNHLDIVLEPVFSDIQHGIFFYEALWRNTTQFAKADLINVARKHGKLKKIDYVLLLQVINVLQCNNRVKISINLPNLALVDDVAYRNMYYEAILRSAVADQLILEISEAESVPLRDLHSVLQDFRSIGCQIAIDDFGTGVSSIEMLDYMRPDIVKLAPVFTLNIDRHSDIISEFMSCIVKVCSACHMPLVAEYVSDEKRLAYCRAAGIHIFQGYLFPSVYPESLCAT